MTAPRGGYQPPARPATVSGPGKLSRRTDGGAGQPIRDLPNPDYGEQQTFRQMESAAPMAQAPAGPATPAAPVAPADLSNVTPFDAPTDRPHEPVTAGAAAGPGPGPAALGLPANDPGVAYLRDVLPTLELMANMPMASQTFKQFVRRVRAEM